MRNAYFLVLVLTLVVFAVSGASSAAAQSPAGSVGLVAQTDSGMSGTTSLTDLGNGKTRVDIRLSPADGDHPVHIHEGTCAGPNPAPKHALSNVRDGTSVTVVNVSMADLGRAPHAINVHKSAPEIATIVACGDLAVSAAGMSGAAPTATGAGGDVTLLAPSGDPDLPGLVAMLAGIGGVGLGLRRLARW